MDNLTKLKEGHWAKYHRPLFKVGDVVELKHPRPCYAELGIMFYIEEITVMTTSEPFYSGLSDTGRSLCGWESDLKRSKEGGR